MSEGRTPAPSIRAARSGADWAEVARLFRAYADSLPFSLNFQCFGGEVEGLPGAYAPPAGNAWLAEVDGMVAGCVALKPLEPGIAELKRLYVAPPARGQQAGRALVTAALDYAVGAGYGAVRLDTVASMVTANRLYAKLGFRPIGAYCHNPLPDARFFERRLADLREDKAS
jgi:GNAT superfamily N-acetyltransferase